MSLTKHKHILNHSQGNKPEPKDEKNIPHTFKV